MSARKPQPPEKDLRTDQPLGADVFDALPDPTHKLFFESPKNRYWEQAERGFLELSEGNALRLLQRWGFDASRPKAGGNSPADEKLLDIQRERRVTFVGSLPGYRPGFQTVNRQPVLITDGPQLLEPHRGDWPTIQEFAESLFCDGEHNQFDRVMLWLKESVEDLRDKRLSSHLALILIGAAGCGKTQFKDQIIRPLLGGREAQPFSFLQGKTDFNADLFEAELLVVDDESSASDWRSREGMKARIKILTATGQHRHHPKFGKAMVVPTYWRLVMALNNDGNNLLVLPHLESSVLDKLLMFRCQRASIFAGVHTSDQRGELNARIAGELPAFLHWLLHEFTAATDVPQGRFGVAHWQHPEPVEQLYDLSAEAEYDGVLCTTLFRPPNPAVPWEGTQADLKRELYDDTAAARQLSDVIGRGINSCRALLNNLSAKYPRRYLKRHTKKGVVWSIYPPGMGCGEDEAAIATQRHLELHLQDAQK